MTAINENGQLYWTFEEIASHKEVQLMAAVFHFNYREKAIQAFSKTYLLHMASLGNESRLQYSLDNVKSIFWKHEENCFRIYYKNGEWLHYSTTGEWY